MSQTVLNAHWAFHSAPKQDDYLSAIAVREPDLKVLRAAREDIRATLRAGMAAWQSHITKQALFERNFMRSAAPDPTLKPRFRIQGSFAYDTANDPAQSPPQQIDMDDGLYLPTEFLNEQSGNRPIVASQGYFQIVETILKPLCEKKGWQLKEKDSCVRVKISARAHIDIPLYAIPLAEFNRLQESLAKADSMAADAALQSQELPDWYYREIPVDQIMLAHRTNGWQPSDPRKIEDWFITAVKLHGYVIRRVCRYLKAWRDVHWPDQPLSSLAIMASVVSIVESLKLDFSESRDDVALLLITEQLASAFATRVPNPVFPDMRELDLDRDWGDKRKQFVQRANELHSRINEALNGTESPSKCLTELKKCFGSRMTTDTSVIRTENRETAVRSYQPARVPPPVVGRTTSG